MIFHCELERDPHQVEGKHSHPTRAVALLEMGAIRKTGVAVEHADVIESEKTALENIVIFGVFAVHPPGEGDKHFVENSFQKRAIAFAGLLALNLVDAPCRPGQHRRIYVAEIPFVSRNLAVRMLEPFAHDYIELRFGELDVDKSQRETMESQVPRGVPGEFPFVRHRHDSVVVEMTPLGVTTIQTFVRRRRLARIAVQPLLDDVMIKLFVPKQPAERLSLNGTMFLSQR